MRQVEKRKISCFCYTQLPTGRCTIEFLECDGVGLHGQDRQRQIQLEVTIRLIPDHAKRYHSGQLRLLWKPARLITRTTFVKLSDGMLNLLDRCSNFIGAGVPFAPRRKTVLLYWAGVNRWLVVGREEALTRSSLFEASPLRSRPQFTTRGTS